MFVDGSGSMYKTDVKNGYNKFLEDTGGNGFTVCEVYNGDENWILPFMTDLTPNSPSGCTPPVSV